MFKQSGEIYTPCGEIYTPCGEIYTPCGEIYTPLWGNLYPHMAGLAGSWGWTWVSGSCWELVTGRPRGGGTGQFRKSQSHVISIKNHTHKEISCNAFT